MARHDRIVTGVIGVIGGQREQSATRNKLLSVARGRQSRLMSLVEAVTNVVVGYGAAVATQLLVFPMFGLRASLRDNIGIAAVFTMVSLGRSYGVRRAFEWWHAGRN